MWYIRELMSAARHTMFGLAHTNLTDEIGMFLSLSSRQFAPLNAGSTVIGRVWRYSNLLHSLLNMSLHMSLFTQLSLQSRVHLITRNPCDH